MDITVCGESLWANMRHSANVSYLTIYFYFGACVSVHCACVCLCVAVLSSSLFFICRWKSTFILRIILICWIFLYMFSVSFIIVVFFIHLIQLKSQHFCFTILKPFSPLYSSASKWIGRLLFLLLFFSVCVFFALVFFIWKRYNRSDCA